MTRHGESGKERDGTPGDKSPAVWRRFFDLVVRRIGVTPQERLAWAVDFAQRDPAEVTPAEWQKYREELTAWRLGGGGMPASGSDDGPDLLPEAVVRKAHADFRLILGDFITTGRAYVGQFTIEFWAVRLDPAQFPVLRKRSRRATYDPPLPELDDPGDELRFILGVRLDAFGHLLRACPAPAVRGEPGERCGRWFVAERPNQTYCSRTCQTRATTRAARAREQTPATRPRRGRRGPMARGK